MNLLRRQYQNMEDIEFSSSPPYLKEIMYMPYFKGYCCPRIYLVWWVKNELYRTHQLLYWPSLANILLTWSFDSGNFPNTSQIVLILWYTNLEVGSINSWNEMTFRFCRKYFQIENWTTMEDLNTTVQESKEGLVDYVKHFRNLALDCYESKSRKEIVRICICNIVNNQWVFLRNHDIMLFSLLLENN